MDFAQSTLGHTGRMILSRTDGSIVSVSSDNRHRFSKQPRPFVQLLAGLGVEGDAHAGTTVQHVYDRRRDPQRPNLRQVHLLHAELLDWLAGRGYIVAPGELGENLTTRGLDLLERSVHTLIHINDARLRLTGLRQPCVQIDRFAPGLERQLIADARARRYLAGVMSVVEVGGRVQPGDSIQVELPPGEPQPLQVV